MAYIVVAERTFRDYALTNTVSQHRLPRFRPKNGRDIHELTRQAIKGQCLLPTKRTPYTLNDKPYIKEELLYAPIKIKTDYGFEDISFARGSYYDGY